MFIWWCHPFVLWFVRLSFVRICTAFITFKCTSNSITLKCYLADAAQWLLVLFKYIYFFVASSCPYFISRIMHCRWCRRFFSPFVRFTMHLFDDCWLCTVRQNKNSVIEQHKNGNKKKMRSQKRGVNWRIKTMLASCHSSSRNTNPLVFSFFLSFFFCCCSSVSLQPVIAMRCNLLVLVHRYSFVKT